MENQFEKKLERELNELNNNPQEIAKKFDELIDKELEEFEREKQAALEAFEYQKKYLIEEILNNGEVLAKELEAKKEISFETSQKSFDELLKMEEEALSKKRSFWTKLMDYIFK